jgi:hypothetical protein
MQRVAILLLGLLPGLAAAQTVGPPLVGTTSTVNDGPGDQTDPHVSGGRVAYTSELNGVSEIRYHDLVTTTDLSIPTNGGFDFLSDISGTRIVYTHVTDKSAIHVFDTATNGPSVELDPQPNADRRNAAIGHQTVAWQDFGLSQTGFDSEVVTYNLNTSQVTRLTNDALLDRTPAVSADGNVVVWSKCQINGTQCDVWQATSMGGLWTPVQLTGVAGDDTLPDTNGEVVVYGSTRAVAGATERDIFWQPVGGGIEQQLEMAGRQQNPNIAKNLIAFESRDDTAATPNWDIWLYDLSTETLYQLTNTPTDETLNDISVAEDGLARVVWTVLENGSRNVYAFSFRLQEPCVEDPSPGSCAAPGNRALLASATLVRQHGWPEWATKTFASEPGEGLLCIDNGFESAPRATSGVITVNFDEVIGPSSLKHSVASIEREIELKSANKLLAVIAGQPGSSYRVQVYGPVRNSCPAPDDELEVCPGDGHNHRWLYHRVRAKLKQALRKALDEAAEKNSMEGGAHPQDPGTNAHDDDAPPPANDPDEPKVGCSSLGGGMSFAALMLVGMFLLLQRSRAPVKVHLRRRR